MANAALRNAENGELIDSVFTPDFLFKRYLDAAKQKQLHGIEGVQSLGTEPMVIFTLRDEERHFFVRCNHPSESWCRTVCRLVIDRDGSARPMFSFSTAALPYAIPEDFVAQEAVNDLLADMLEEEMRDSFPNFAIAEELHSSWRRCRSYIERRWEKNEKAGMGVRRLSNLRQYGRNRLAVAAPSTRLGVSAYVGVEEQDSGRFGSISSLQDKALKLSI